MRFPLLAFGLLWSGSQVGARPHPGPATTSTRPRDATAGDIPGLAIHRRSVEAADAEPGDLIYEDTPNAYIFEVGYDLVGKLNEVGNDNCVTSEDDCKNAVDEVLNALPESGNYFVRSVEDDNEPRQLLSAAIGAQVAVWAYVLHKLFSAPEPTLIHVEFDPESDDKGPIEVTLPKANFPESVTGTETSTETDVPFGKIVLITTPLATNEKAVSSLSSAIAAIATNGPVIPSISDYGQELPGWFQINATLDQQLEIALLPGVENLVDDGEIYNDNIEIAADEDASAVRRSESKEATAALHKRGSGSRDLPSDAPDDHGACLRFASWADGMQNAPKYYAYQDKQGQGYPIYSLESGFDLTHDEFGEAGSDYPDHDPVSMGQPVNPEWSWFNGHLSETDPRTSLSDSEPSYDAHGTSMMGVLMGQTAGVLPQSRPILVRMGYSIGGLEAGLRATASHIYQRQQTQAEGRSPIVAIASMPRMYDSHTSPDGATWSYDICLWSQRFGHHLQLLVDLGATVLLAGGNFDSTTPKEPLMFVAIALGLGQKCMDQYGIEMPHVLGLDVVDSVDTATRLSIHGNDAHGWGSISASFSGPWECPTVQYDNQAGGFSIGSSRGTSITTYWTAGILADLAYQAEDRNEYPDPDTPSERSAALFEAADDLEWYVTAGDTSQQQAALWNGLRLPDGRSATSTAAPEPTPMPSISSAVSEAAPTSSAAPPPPAPSQSWASGWCGMHVQQRTYNSVASALTVTIKDAEQREIGGDSKQGPNLNYGDSYDVSSELPVMVVVTAPGPDEAVQFAYGDQAWTSDDEQCSTGKWDNGPLSAYATREMDCGFSC